MLDLALPFAGKKTGSNHCRCDAFCTATGDCCSDASKICKVALNQKNSCNGQCHLPFPVKKDDKSLCYCIESAKALGNQCGKCVYSDFFLKKKVRNGTIIADGRLKLSFCFFFLLFLLLLLDQMTSLTPAVVLQNPRAVALTIVVSLYIFSLFALPPHQKNTTVAEMIERTVSITTMAVIKAVVLAMYMLYVEFSACFTFFLRIAFYGWQ